MKATQAKLLEFLKRSPQFAIPIYQRTYSWTERECQQLWDDVMRAGLLLLTGARKGEALHANWNNFDLYRKVWTVSVSKSGRPRRIVLNQAAADLIKELRAEAEMRGYPLHPNSPVFYNPKTRERYDSFYAAWHRARAKAELPDVRFHDLRHTFASMLINQGVSLYEVQRLLGHHHITMTERYSHLPPDTLQERVERVSYMVS